eukprot:1158216-Pelagomonas_calceolata.AAC.1
MSMHYLLLQQRAEALHRVAQLMREHAQPIADCMVKEIAKPSKDALTEVREAHEHMPTCIHVRKCVHKARCACVCSVAKTECEQQACSLARACFSLCKHGDPRVSMSSAGTHQRRLASAHNLTGLS